MIESASQYLTDEIRKEVISTLVNKFNSNYIFPEKAAQAGELLIGKLNNGEYQRFEDGNAFSQALTEDLQKTTADKHVRVRFITDTNENNTIRSDAEWEEEYLRNAKATNFGFYKVERLEGNIGYIDLREFVNAQIGGETAVHAMNFLAHTDALIIDLRKNKGGHPGMIALISSYLFEEMTHLNTFYNRLEDSYSQSWTLPYVPGQKYGNKPVYVLTSHFTFSAGEEFTYNLKNLERATIIGEVTGGGAHPGGIVQLNAHYSVFIPTGRAINPITNTNWEGTGVEPHIKLSKEEAFDYAYAKAKNEI